MIIRAHPRFRSASTVAAALLLCAATYSGEPPATFPAPSNSEASTEPLTPPTQALQHVKAPPGFQVSLFAHEPQVQQPIALTLDTRGRLWIAENYTYAEAQLRFDSRLRDRIIILQDTRQQGRADHRTVFWDQAQQLTSIELGFGGVWALCPPHLLFIPDRDADDVPDGPPQVLLDGWDHGIVHHNIANGLKWGPDGWLYGRHGIQARSLVGRPGDPPDKRVPVSCGIWRYHPQRQLFEMVARGTTNPWGHDWDDYGELFFINTVIGHLWHALPGAYFERMYGEHDNPHLYQLMPQTADHKHWDSREKWQDVRQGMSSSTTSLGGGHAHCGFMIYLAEQWPASFRNGAFTLNLHGHRINHDRLQRSGTAYVATHQPDLISFADPWFRGIDLLYGPDGSVFVADWSDTGECHEATGVHRTSGRIYKVTYADPTTPSPSRASDPPLDLAKQSDHDLVELQLNPNDWLVRRARLLLQERAAQGADLSAARQRLRDILDQHPDATRKLRALWALYAIKAIDQPSLLKLLQHRDDEVRKWAVRLLLDQLPLSPTATQALTNLAQRESSGLVQLYLASALQKIALPERWPIAHALVAKPEFADDPFLPLMIYYGLEPAAAQAPDRALAFTKTCPWPVVRRLLSRRLASLHQPAAKPQ